ncbi:MAG: hypothetical protein M3Q58_09810 [Bacteroidota bacterium]|nr:hypothetical protein [Bacteroidota bacterium]
MNIIFKIVFFLILITACNQDSSRLDALKKETDFSLNETIRMFERSKEDIKQAHYNDSEMVKLFYDQSIVVNFQLKNILWEVDEIRLNDSLNLSTKDSKEKLDSLLIAFLYYVKNELRLPDTNIVFKTIGNYKVKYSSTLNPHFLLMDNTFEKRGIGLNLLKQELYQLGYFCNILLKSRIEENIYEYFTKVFIRINKDLKRGEKAEIEFFPMLLLKSPQYLSLIGELSENNDTLIRAIDTVSVINGNHIYTLFNVASGNHKITGAIQILTPYGEVLKFFPFETEINVSEE